MLYYTQNQRLSELNSDELVEALKRSLRRGDIDNFVSVCKVLRQKSANDPSLSRISENLPQMFLKAAKNFLSREQRSITKDIARGRLNWVSYTIGRLEQIILDLTLSTLKAAEKAEVQVDRQLNQILQSFPENFLKSVLPALINRIERWIHQKGAKEPEVYDDELSLIEDITITYQKACEKAGFPLSDQEIEKLDRLLKSAYLKASRDLLAKAKEFAEEGDEWMFNNTVENAVAYADVAGSPLKDEEWERIRYLEKLVALRARQEAKKYQ